MSEIIVSEIIVSEIIVSEIIVSGIIVPEIIVPEIIVPEIIVSEIIVFDIIVSEIIVFDIIVSEIIVFDIIVSRHNLYYQRYLFICSFVCLFVGVFDRCLVFFSFELDEISWAPSNTPLNNTTIFDATFLEIVCVCGRCFIQNSVPEVSCMF